MVQSFHNNQPIYLQIVQRLCRQILRGELGPGEKLPSVRDLAVQMGVNPNTVQRVYSELERLAVAETRRGLGTFITEHEPRLQRLREELMAEQMENFIRDMQEMGFTANEIIDGVRQALQELN